MEELLVVTACLYQKGCPDTASYYYNQRPQLQKFVNRTETEVKQIAGPVVVDYLTPVAMFAAGASGTLYVYRNVTLKYNRESLALVFKKEF